MRLGGGQLARTALARRLVVGVLVAALGVVVPAYAGALPSSAPRAGGCAPGSDGCVPTAEQCRSEGTKPDNVVTFYGLDRVGVCVSAANTNALYVGGSLDPGPCGSVQVADQNATDPYDANDCARATDPLPGSTWSETTVTAADGVALHVDIYRPEHAPATRRTPVVVIDTPYANTAGTGAVGPNGADLSPTGRTVSSNVGGLLGPLVPALFDDGFTVVVAAFRGTGGSGGCDDFGGAKARADVRSVVEWAATRPWSTGRVGLYGMSAAGWSALMGAAARPRGLAAVVAESPPITRYAQAYDHGVAYAPSPAANAVNYGVIGSVPPGALTSQAEYGAWSQHVTGACAASNSAASMSADPASPFWKERDLLPLVAGTRVPTLLSQGFLDDNVKPDVLPHLWSALRGPRSLWLGQWMHVQAEAPPPANPALAPTIGLAGFREHVLDWLLAYVGRDDAAADRLSAQPPVVVERSDGTWRAQADWPRSRGARVVKLATGSYLDAPGNSAEPRPDQCVPSSVDGSQPCARTRTGVGAWSFGAPSSEDVTLSGSPVLAATVTTTRADATLVGLLYDVDAAGNAVLISRAATRLASTAAQRTTLELAPQDWLLRANHRLGVLLTGSDDGWYAPQWTGSTVTVTGGWLAVPAAQLRGSTALPAGRPSAEGRKRPSFVVPS